MRGRCGQMFSEMSNLAAPFPLLRRTNTALVGEQEQQGRLLHVGKRLNPLLAPSQALALKAARMPPFALAYLEQRERLLHHVLAAAKHLEIGGDLAAWVRMTRRGGGMLHGRPRRRGSAAPRRAGRGGRSRPAPVRERAAAGALRRGQRGPTHRGRTSMHPAASSCRQYCIVATFLPHLSMMLSTVEWSLRPSRSFSLRYTLLLCITCGEGNYNLLVGAVHWEAGVWVGPAAAAGQGARGACEAPFAAPLLALQWRTPASHVRPRIGRVRIRMPRPSSQQQTPSNPSQINPSRHHTASPAPRRTPCGKKPSTDQKINQKKMCSAAPAPPRAYCGNPSINQKK